MRAHYLQHVPFEGLGSIESWLVGAGYEISVTRFFASESVPEPEGIDLLIVLGGAMSVNDTCEFPWIESEKDFIRRVIKADIPVLGICLGAQLIASAMDGEVFPNPEKEIGWFPVASVEANNSRTFEFPELTDVFHWHGETFTLPEGAVLLATSIGCRNQAFQIGRKIIGLQFHLETTPASAKAIVENARHELVEGRYVQSEAAMLAVPEERYASINRLMGDVLEYLHESNA